MRYSKALVGQACLKQTMQPPPQRRRDADISTLKRGSASAKKPEPDGWLIVRIAAVHLESTRSSAG
jgi:hypothetical protein